MANSYVQSSFDFKIENPEALPWLEEVQQHLDHLHEIEEDEIKVKRLKELLSFEGDFDHDQGWDWTLDTGEGFGIFYGDENPNVELMLVVLSEMLCRFDPEGIITFEWAYVCSKPRPGEFGGGAAVVVAGNWDAFDTHEWTRMALQEVNTKETPPSTSEFEEVRRRIQELRTADLDELVHDYKSQEGSGINNEGQEAQMLYLLMYEFPVPPSTLAGLLTFELEEDEDVGDPKLPADG